MILSLILLPAGIALTGWLLRKRHVRVRLLVSLFGTGLFFTAALITHLTAPLTEDILTWSIFMSQETGFRLGLDESSSRLILIMVALLLAMNIRRMGQPTEFRHSTAVHLYLITSVSIGVILSRDLFSLGLAWAAGDIFWGLYWSAMLKKTALQRLPRSMQSLFGSTMVVFVALLFSQVAGSPGSSIDRLGNPAELLLVGAILVKILALIRFPGPAESASGVTRDPIFSIYQGAGFLSVLSRLPVPSSSDLIQTVFLGMGLMGFAWFFLGLNRPMQRTIEPQALLVAITCLCLIVVSQSPISLGAIIPAAVVLMLLLSFDHIREWGEPDRDRLWTILLLGLLLGVPWSPGYVIVSHGLDNLQSLNASVWLFMSVIGFGLILTRRLLSNTRLGDAKSVRISLGRFLPEVLVISISVFAFRGFEIRTVNLYAFSTMLLLCFGLALLATRIRFPPISIDARWIRWLDPQPILGWMRGLIEILRQTVQVFAHFFEGEGALLWTLLFMLFIVFALI